MNNSINMLSPFVLYCQKVIPLAFDESMSYYECLCALYSYLKEQVVPAVNSNAEALEEVQKAMVELKDYVDHYFDNLDIQTEIDNKLDEMADSGELAQIISQYLQMSFIFGFDTIADLKAGDNFIAGNIVRVLGKTSYATGDGAFYRVRALTVYDVIDDDEIVGLTNYPSLIAEKITDAGLNAVNSRVDTVESDIDDLEDAIELMTDKCVIMIGDSYANRTNSWEDRIQTICGLDSSNSALQKVSGVGFCNTINGDNFITMLTDGITLDPDKVTDIIVCGGWNDRTYTDVQIATAIQSFISTAKTNYPNAKIHIGSIGWACYGYTDVNLSQIMIQMLAVKNAYALAETYDPAVHYLKNVEYSLHWAGLFDNTYNHPNADGQAWLAKNILSAWLYGSCNMEMYATNISSSYEAINGSLASGNLYSMIVNDESRLFGHEEVQFNFDGVTSIALNNIIDIGYIKGGSVLGKNSVPAVTCCCIVKTVNNGYFEVPGTFYMQEGKLRVNLRMLNRQGNGWLTDALNYIAIRGLQFRCDSMEQY